MKIRFLANCALILGLFASCSENTENLGSSLIEKQDKLNVLTDTFTVNTRSIKVDSVLSRTSMNYLGTVVDPEANTYVSSNFMSQFHTLENFSFPPIDSIMSRSGGQIIADSCELTLLYDSYYGDSLTTMKVTAYELDKPMLENRTYYSNFNPRDNGYIRTNGIKVEQPYKLVDLNVSAAERAKSTYQPSIRIWLNDAYIDKNGVSYTNFGTYIMQNYYAHPANFKNAFSFIKNVVPGFYFKSSAGLGAMANIYLTRLAVYYRYKSNGKETNAVAVFSGTEEVLSSTDITNDANQIQTLVNDQTCTYLKTPAGIFTEMTLPVEDIMRGHENDTLNTAKIVLNRINNATNNPYDFSIPQNIVMVPKSDLYSFFESRIMVDNRTTFLAQYNSNLNNYTFSNISQLVHTMYEKKKQGTTDVDWNKVVIVPVSTTSTYDASTRQNILTSIANQMGLTSTKLVGGANNPNKVVQITVIYSKFD